MSQSSHDVATQETVMDVTEEQIARVYGQAFLGAANSQADTAGLVEELVSLVVDVLDKFPALEDTLTSALVSQEQKLDLVDRILAGKASATVLNFVKVLLAHDRAEMLRSTSRMVQKLYNRQSGKVDVQVRVASPMDDALRDEVAASLQHAMGAEPALAVQVDPSLIAGFVVKVGDTVYDGSVKTRFEQARKAMIARAVEMIETRPETFFNGDSR